MAMTVMEVQSRLESLGVKVMVPPDENVAAHERGIRYATSRYVNSEGEHAVLIIAKLNEAGEYLEFLAPAVYNVRECKFKGAVFAAMMELTYVSNHLQFEYDPSDGEIRVSVDMPICDGTATGAQMLSLLGAIVNGLESFHPVIVHAMETGRIDKSLIERKEGAGAIPDEVAGLIEQLGGIDELRRLAEAKAGTAS